MSAPSSPSVPSSVAHLCERAALDVDRQLAEADEAWDRLCLGADVQEVEPVRAALAAHGPRYVQHLFSGAEQADMGWPDAPAEHLADQAARRFAAKEAVLKALRPTVRTWSWTEIHLQGTTRWQVRLDGAARHLSSHRHVERWALSCVSGADHAVALAVGVGNHQTYTAQTVAELGRS